VLLGDNWKGGDAGLKYLKRIPGLRNLYVAQNKKFQPATAKALSSLESSIPNLSIQYRGLSCLGVRGAITNVNGAAVGCQVTSVEKGSAADKGNVKAYDQITHFANNPVANFQTLVKLIAEHNPGETVQIDVLRRGKKHSLKVVLQGWKK
jgi:S1-C subfamily serine protease